MNSRTLVAAMSVSSTIAHDCSLARGAIVTGHAHGRGAQDPDRECVARRRGERRRPHRRWRPLPCGGGVRPLPGSLARGAAPAHLRRLRARDRRPHPRALDQDLYSGRKPMTNAEIREFIENAIRENQVMLFMKGTPHQPACGFSARASACLNALGVRYAALDILPDPRIRQELSEVSGWPTIPQLFVDGKLVGGSDIVVEMFESGELADLLQVEQPEAEPEPKEPARRPLGLENRLE